MTSYCAGRVKVLQSAMIFLVVVTMFALFGLMKVTTNQPVRNSLRTWQNKTTETTRKSSVFTVTVPRLHLRNLKQAIIKESANTPQKLIADSANELRKSENGSSVDGRNVQAQVNTIIKHLQSKGEKMSKKPRDWAIYSVHPAKWPPPIHWPDAWIRSSDNESPQSFPAGEHTNSITCDLTQLSRNLRPKLPAHFELRHFRQLPRRYSDIATPIPAPYCGTHGLLSPWKLIDHQKVENKENRKLWMLFIVKSAPSYAENRMTVRQTWASSFTKHPIFVLFVVGKSHHSDVTKSLRNESKIYGDILECDFVDHYHKLPTKILSTFRWILERDFDIQFFTMTDDDCLVNLPNVERFFDTNVTTTSDYNKNIYCGFMHHVDAVPLKIPKWAVTKAQYSERFYPTFCHGGLWTLARPLMHGIYCVSEITKIGDFFLEDVLLTGILREKLNFKDTNIKRVVYRSTKKEKLLFFHGAHKKTASVSHDNVISEWKKWQKLWKNMTTAKTNAKT